MAQKEGAVKGLTGGIEHLFKKNKVEGGDVIMHEVIIVSYHIYFQPSITPTPQVEYVKGTATIEADKSISVAMLDGTWGRGEVVLFPIFSYFKLPFLIISQIREDQCQKHRNCHWIRRYPTSQRGY